MTARTLTAAAVAALTLAIIAPAGAPAADWTAYRTRDEGFSVRFPGDPEVESKVNGPGDGRARSTSTRVVADKRLYLVISMKPLGEKAPAGNLDSAYRGYKQDQLQQDASEVIEEGKTKAGAVEGRSLLVKRKSGMHQLSHVYIHDGRLYIVVLLAGKQADLADADARTFLGSLRFDAAGK